MKLKRNDKVLVTTRNSMYWGKQARIEQVLVESETYLVQVNGNDHLTAFYANEVQHIKPKEK